MSKFKKLICLLITTLLLFTFSVCVSASNKTSDSNIKIEVVTDKAEYKATSVAKITATITNASDKDIENVTAQVVFGDLSPAGKKNSQIKKTVDTLEAGESFSFTYKATLDKDEHDLNIFQKIILFFVRLFNGGYTANNNSIDVVAENVTEIDFGKYTAENVIQVGYGTIDTEVDNKENNKLSDDDLLQINEVDVSIDNLMESDEYKNLSDDKFKAQAIIKLLTDLEKDGLIQKDSIHYYEELNQVGYYYICGVSGGVYLDSFNNLIGGISIISKSDSEESTYSVRRTNLNEADDIPNIILTYGWDDSTSTGSLYQKWDNCVKEMSERGSIATIYDSPSVFDYKTMFSDMDFICIGEHGAFDAETNTYCFAVNGENASIQADIAYNTDLYFERVLKRETNDGTMYFITPEFFSYYYNSKLNDTIVFISSCSGFGANGAIDYKFAKAFHDDCGANAVIGFHNDVWLNYALDIINEFSSSLLNGYTVTEALNIATLKHGDNHNIWIKANEDLNNYASDIGMTVGQYIETNPAAIPIMYGEPNAKLDIQTSTITGIVTNSETNSPIQYVSVQVIDNESDSLIPVARATTNAKGEYQIPNLPYGNYSISFTHDDYEYYGTALVVSQASCVKNAVLTPAGERAKITGTVTDGATNEPIPYVTIQFINSENVPVWTTITNENGTFEAKVPYDTYTVTYTHSDYEPSQDTIVIDKEEVVINKTLGEKEGRPVADSGEWGAVIWTLYEDGELIINGSGAIQSSSWKKEDIKTVTIGDGITRLVGEVFDGCNNLESVTIGESVTHIGNCAFRNCKKLTEIIIPDSVTTIGDSAFFYCENLSSVTIGKGVTTIGQWAFSYCSNLECIEIGENLDIIYDDAFGHCSSLVDVYAKDINSWLSISFISDESNPMSYAQNLYFNNILAKDIIIPNNILSIGDYAFYGCENITSVSIPNSIATIGTQAFYKCSKLENLTIPDSVLSIDGGAFAYCNNLTSVELSENLSSLERELFGWCYNLKEVTIPNNVSKIGDWVFYNCNSLCNIVIGDNVKTIGEKAFERTSITSIIIPDGITSIGNGAFYQCNSLSSISIGKDVSTLGDNPFVYCSNLKEINVNENNEQYSSDDIGVLFNKDKTILIQYPRGNENTIFEIPNTVTTIYSNAFNNCDNLTSVTISNNVTSVGGFSGCDKLKTVTLGNNVSLIESNAFYNCTYLEEIIIPKSVIEIGNSAFYYCMNLSDVYYIGTQEEWKAISIDPDNTYLTNATIHYNS